MAQKSSLAYFNKNQQIFCDRFTDSALLTQSFSGERPVALSPATKNNFCFPIRFTVPQIVLESFLQLS